jgi:hypothetical protein
LLVRTAVPQHNPIGTAGVVNPVALHLRAMNMLYEGPKTNSTIVIEPSSAIETMQLGGLAGLTALTMGIGQDKALGAANNDPQLNLPPQANPPLETVTIAETK